MTKVVRKQVLVLKVCRFLNEEDKAELRQSVIKQMQSDGVVVLPVGVDGFTVDYDSCLLMEDK